MTGKRAAGIEKLRAELERRGAPENIVEECLAELSPDDQKQGMLDALSAKFKPTDDRARAGRFLLSRGFAEDEIESALDDFFRTD
jgi:SOS response regulatory protein OraA/RecX